MDIVHTVYYGGKLNEVPFERNTAADRTRCILSKNRCWDLVSCTSCMHVCMTVITRLVCVKPYVRVTLPPVPQLA